MIDDRGTQQRKKRINAMECDGLYIQKNISLVWLSLVWSGLVFLTFFLALLSLFCSFIVILSVRLSSSVDLPVFLFAFFFSLSLSLSLSLAT